jgi:RNA polymerase sigma factor (TIGR02999 family)
MHGRTVTRLLLAWGQGDEAALHQLAPIVYRELEKLASRYLLRERNAQTLETGALVHEAYLRLLGQRQISWKSRSQFFGIAALMMRRILVEHARRRQYARLGRGVLHLPLDSAAGVTVDRSPDLAALDDTLHRLGERYPQLARLVELRFFGGLTEEELADVFEVSVPTIKRRWRLARAWLYRRLASEEGLSD